MNMKDVKGYEGLYAVTDDGQVWSHRNKIFLKQRENNSGYLMVNLSKDCKQKTFTVHRLVLSTFNPIENMENYEASHIDENRYNNTLENLEWLEEHKDNCNMPLHKERVSINSSRKIRPIMCVETGAVYKSMMEAERQTGIHHNLIWRVVRGERRTAGGFHWVYSEVEAA